MPQWMRGNVSLHYELDGVGSPVVYITGLGSHSNDVLAVLLRNTLSASYQVLSVDNRGSGQTVVPASASVTLTDMVDDIAAVMEHHHIGKAHVLGISLGGVIALLFALRHPDKVKTLITAVSFAHTEAPSRAGFMLDTRRQMRDQGIPRTIINRYTAVFLLSEAAFQVEGLMDAWINAPIDPFEQTSAGFEQQINALLGYDIREPLKTLTVPTLVISSPDDLLVPPRLQDEIANLIPNAEIKRYPGGHVFMLLPMYSARFVQDVLAFWAQHS